MCLLFCSFWARRTASTTTAPSRPEFCAIVRSGSSSARRRIWMPVAASPSSPSCTLSSTSTALSSATPPPGTKPSSTAARVAKTRVEDALSATRAAVAEGCVAGGGVALLNAVEVLDKVQQGLDGDAATGIQILRRALEEPLRTIAQNSGRDGAVVVEAVRRAQKEQNNKHIGYNVLDDRAEDMVEAGRIDAAKVTRSALENAASIAAMILTTEALITDLPDKERPAAPAMPEY